MEVSKALEKFLLYSDEFRAVNVSNGPTFGWVDDEQQKNKAMQTFEALKDFVNIGYKEYQRRKQSEKNKNRAKD